MIYGANGFLGSLIANMFFEIGEDVICVVRPSAECGRIQNIPIERIERVDPIFWEEMIQKYRLDQKAMDASTLFYQKNL